MDKQQLIDQLNLLITRNFDANKGYTEAAMRVSDLQLRKWLQENAKHRKQYISDLSREVRLLDGTPDQGTSLRGDLHRTWLDFKAEIYDSYAAVLQECITGEKTLVNNYAQVLEEKDLPNALETLLNNQLQQIKQSLTALESIEESVSAYS